MGEPFRLGRVVARSFSIWARNLPVLFVLALVMNAARIPLEEYLSLFARRVVQEMRDRRAEGVTPSWPAGLMPVLVTWALLSAFFARLSEATVIFAAYGHLQGRPATLAQALAGGLRRLPQVSLVALLLLLIEGILLLGLAVLSFRIALALWVPRASDVGRLILWTQVLMVAAPLAVRFLVSPLWVAVPAVVVERRGALRRSWRLTRGHRLAVLAILLLLYGIGWGSSELVSLAPDGLQRFAQRALAWTADLLVVSLSAVFAAVGYHALRWEKEGVDVLKLKDVFA